MQPDTAAEALLSCRLVAALLHFWLTFDTQTLVYSMYTNVIVLRRIVRCGIVLFVP